MSPVLFSIMKKLFIQILLVIFLLTSVVFVSWYISSPTQRNIIEFWMQDRVNSTKARALLIGSSSIIHMPEELLPVACGPYLNRGIDNAHVVDVLYYLKGSILPESLQCAVIYAGENDIFDQKSLMEVEQQMHKLVEVLSTCHGIENIHILPVKMSPARINAWKQFHQFNDLLERHYRNNAAVRVYSNSILMETIEEKKMFVNDGIHLTTHGYVQLIKGFTLTCLDQ